MQEIKFGVNLNNRAPVLGQTSIKQFIELAEMTERLGYHSVWVGDSILSKPRLEPITALAAVSARTTRVQLGIACLISAWRNPLLLAHAFATLDNLSGGRTIAALCTGGGDKLAQEYEMCGVPYLERSKVLQENIEVLRRLWSGDLVSYSGKYFNLGEVRLEPRPLRPPPILIANNPGPLLDSKPTVGMGICKRVARIGDGWMTAAALPKDVHRCIDLIRKYAKENGKDPNSFAAAYQMTVNVNPNPARGRSEAKSFLEAYYNKPYSPEEVELYGAHGTSEDCIRKIRDFISAGIGIFILRFVSPEPEMQLTRFSEEILPSLQNEN